LRDIWKETVLVGSNESIRQFAREIGDRNPLHHDKEAAIKVGFEDIASTGVRIIGYISSMIANEIPLVIVAEVNVRFLRPVYAGMVVTTTCTIVSRKKRLAKASITVKDRIETLLAEASCMLVLPIGV